MFCIMSMWIFGEQTDKQCIDSCNKCKGAKMNGTGCLALADLCSQQKILHRIRNKFREKCIKSATERSANGNQAIRMENFSNYWNISWCNIYEIEMVPFFFRIYSLPFRLSLVQQTDHAAITKYGLRCTQGNFVVLFKLSFASSLAPPC